MWTGHRVLLYILCLPATPPARMCGTGAAGCHVHGGIAASKARGPVSPHGGGPGQTTDGVKWEWGPDFLDGGCPVPIGGPARHVPARRPARAVSREPPGPPAPPAAAAAGPERQ